jgi:hypothetical protein
MSIGAVFLFMWTGWDSVTVAKFRFAPKAHSLTKRPDPASLRAFATLRYMSSGFLIPPHQSTANKTT